ncbi:hypothetical protein FH972_025480 [Carpinus fangiana]|uniref:Rad50/SbcC-type AAA domain-containing protein n=1 Tax=Carpinus fangiana TaxID=176857 RepID=A0A5N6L160_9ROSI|nr:hypothetical protein FH972_025480 [Carpinus fangiana]
MSKIDKLSILGVRSFDNQRSETIQFFTPLTLIVGYNGSGKTTIIECLKYATTGDLPPNSKGGAFIHDPKLCGEREVLAQVKLSFKGTNGAKMVSTRNLQLTVKKTARSQKTLEGSLLMIKDGERLAVSSRVAELDQLMPQYLGVSKAILDNVIFCHQDESLWPLSEPSVLKKKFDEIFEAMKYTKAIENIKVLRKKQNEELGKMKIIEQHAKEDKDKGDRAEKKSRELADQIEDLRAQTHELSDSIKTATQKSEDAWNAASKFEMIIAQLQGKRSEAQYKQANVDELKQSIKRIMHETDDELQTMLDQHDEQVRSVEGDMKTQENHYHELTTAIGQARDQLGLKQSEHGRFEGAKERYGQQLEHRTKLVKDTAGRHSIRGFDGDLDGEKVQDFMERITKMARDQNAAFERARRESQQELRQAQLALNALNDRKTALNQNRENSKGQILANDRKLVEQQASLDQIDFDEGMRARLQASAEDLEARFKQASTEFQSANWDKQIRDTEVELQALKSRAMLLKDELFQVHQRAEGSAQVDVLKKQLKEAQGSLDTMKGAHRDRLNKHLGQAWEEGDLEAVYQRTVDEQNKTVKDAELRRETANTEYKEVEFKMSSANKDLDRKQQELKAASKTILDLIDGEDPAEYPDVVRDVQLSRDTARSDMEGFANLRTYYEQCQKFMADRDCCKLCERSFRTDKERGTFNEKLRKFLSKNDQKDLEQETKEREEELVQLNAISSTYETWKRLSSAEINNVEQEISRLKPRRDALLEQVEDQDAMIGELYSVKREIESLSKTVQTVLKYQSDVSRSEKSLQEIAAKQSQSQQGKSLDDIKTESDEVDSRMNTVQGSLAKLTTDRERSRAALTDLQLELRDVKTKLDKADYQLKEKNALGAALEELSGSSKSQRDTIKAIEKELQELAPQISQAGAKCDDIAARGDEKERDLQGAAKALDSSVSELRLAEREINAFLDAGGPQQVSRSKRDMDNLSNEIQRLEADKTKLTRTINALKEKMTNQEGVRDGIWQNLKYRRDQRALTQLKHEISELESNNVETDRDHHQAEADRWQTERNRLAAEQASLMGQMKSKDDLLAQLLNDWNTDYKDAAYKYKEAHIKVEATRAAVEDLGRYGGALDKAIMKYHGLKMEAINRIIEELWKRTYQGTDVDTILIRSDSENLKGNKSYNYRVCMVKQDVEMDMRGRCSAGQKVLASIIIRLALAECFGVDCGLIALDEPTTNLDRDNIQALAQSLHDIIRQRRAQSNFQLIVITHDEDFLKAMQCQDFCDEYYRVSRDERQKSAIDKQSILEVLRD